jgi:hypothetical protein
MKLTISLMLILLNLNISNAEIMDVGDSGIYPVYDYVENNHHPRSRIDELKEEIENDEILNKIKSQGVSTTQKDNSKPEVQHKDLENLKLDVESEIKFYNKKLKCLMDDIPSKDCENFLKKG